MTAREWLRRRLGPDPAMTATLRELRQERDALTLQVDALGFERDDLTDLLARSEQARTDLRRNVAAAYEPVQVGGCNKMRHFERGTADQHAIRIAAVAEGDTFNSYPCRVCPPYAFFGHRPWHVGHCRPSDLTSVLVRCGTARYGCGCAFTVSTGDTVQVCPDHDEAAA